ncbi:MAG: hypothetical protein M1839_007287 [Geoglossum umbratile]|nr:MAG: hypothetical protein M1839_007287 [Geoglossum umbratile]
MSSRLLPWKKDDSQRRASAVSDRRHSSPPVDDAEALNPPSPAIDPPSQRSQPSSSRRRPVSFFTSQSSSQSPVLPVEERRDSALDPPGGVGPEESESMFSRPPTAGYDPSRTKFISRKVLTGTRSAPQSSHGHVEPPPATMQTQTQTQPSGLVELPGSLLLDNEGFPSTDPAAGRLARWSRGPEKLLPSLAASLGLEKPKATTETHSVASRDSVSVRSSVSNSTSPDQTAKSSSTTPQSPNPDGTGRHGAARMATRPGFGSPKVISEAQRVIEVLARRVRDLESSLRERDEAIRSFKSDFEGSRRAHENELARARELHSTEIRSLKATFTLLERTQEGGAPSPLQTSTLHGSSKIAGHTMGNSQNLHRSWGTEPEEAQQSVGNASEGVPSSTVSEPAAESVEGSAQEDITLEFEKRLEGERRRRKEVLERAEDLHKSREAELIEKLDARDKQVCELEEEITVWKDDVERVEETLQKFIRFSEEHQAEAIQNAAAKREAEADCIALKETIAAKDEALRDLRAELEEAKRNIDRLSLLAGNSNGNGQQLPAETSTTDNKVDLAYVQKLEADIEAHVEDIRLYKLDVRGYRKDVRSRDTKISYMTQHVDDLTKKVDAKTIEVETLRQRLAAVEKKSEMVLQQRQHESQQRLRPKTGLGLDLDEVADTRRGQTTPDWPLPQIRQRNHNSPALIRHTRNSSSGNSNSLGFSDRGNSENEHGVEAAHPRGFQSQTRPLSPPFAPRTPQQDQEALSGDNTPTLPSREGRNKPLPMPKVNGMDTAGAPLRQGGGLEQPTRGVGVAMVGGVPGESWILD